MHLWTTRGNSGGGTSREDNDNFIRSLPYTLQLDLTKSIMRSVKGRRCIRRRRQRVGNSNRNNNKQQSTTSLQVQLPTIQFPALIIFILERHHSTTVLLSVLIVVAIRALSLTACPRSYSSIR